MRADVRHDLKHDRFAETVAGTAAGTLTWATEHRPKMIGGVVAAVLIVGLAVGGWFWYQQQQEKANDLLGHAVHVYDTPLRPPGTPVMPGIETFASAAERAQAARRDFAALASQHPFTSAGKMAQYFVGLTYRDEGNTAQAEKSLQEVAGSSNHEVASLAKYALASLYAANNRNPDAIKMYKDLIDHPSATVSKAATQLELAGLYEQVQQPVEAARLYDQVKKDNPKSPEAQYADAKVAALKAGTPPK